MMMWWFLWQITPWFIGSVLNSGSVLDQQQGIQGNSKTQFRSIVTYPKELFFGTPGTFWVDYRLKQLAKTFIPSLFPLLQCFTFAYGNHSSPTILSTISDILSYESITLGTGILDRSCANWWNLTVDGDLQILIY